MRIHKLIEKALFLTIFNPSESKSTQILHNLLQNKKYIPKQGC